MVIDKFTKTRVLRVGRSRFKASSFAVYAGTLFVLIALVMSGYQSPSVGAENDATKLAAIDQSSAVANTSVAPLTTMDDVRSANLAASLALSTNLSVANSVYNQSISMSASIDLGQYDATTISKAQVTDFTAMNVLSTYTVVEGDTASSIAAKFGISAQTIRWANNLTGDNVTAGSTVVVPLVDGVVYTVKSSDILDTIANKYKSNVDSIITVNDLDGTTVVTGTKILLPDGILPENERPGYVAPRVTVIWSGTASYAGNTYSYGYCTWYAYNRRAELGRPIPSNLGHARTWASRAAGMGYTVNNTPAVGAIMQNGGGLGHVAVVEAIYPDGSIMVSEMNAHYGVDFDGHQSGWGRISHRVVNNPGDYNFIH